MSHKQSTLFYAIHILVYCIWLESFEAVSLGFPTFFLNLLLFSSLGFTPFVIWKSMFLLIVAPDDYDYGWIPHLLVGIDLDLQKW